MENILFMDTFQHYSSKDGEDGRRIEDFTRLSDIVNCDLENRLKILLNGSVEDLIEKTTKKRC